MATSDKNLTQYIKKELYKKEGIQFAAANSSEAKVIDKLVTEFNLNDAKSTKYSDCWHKFKQYSEKFFVSSTN